MNVDYLNSVFMKIYLPKCTKVELVDGPGLFGVDINIRPSGLILLWFNYITFYLADNNQTY
jgi:hypothetical protein